MCQSRYGGTENFRLVSKITGKKFIITDIFIKRFPQKFFRSRRYEILPQSIVHRVISEHHCHIQMAAVFNAVHTGKIHPRHRNIAPFGDHEKAFAVGPPEALFIPPHFVFLRSKFSQRHADQSVVFSGKNGVFAHGEFIIGEFHNFRFIKCFAENNFTFFIFDAGSQRKNAFITGGNFVADLFQVLAGKDGVAVMRIEQTYFDGVEFYCQRVSTADETLAIYRVRQSDRNFVVPGIFYTHNRQFGCGAGVGCQSYVAFHCGNIAAA